MYPNKFGESIKIRRKEQGISLRKMAELVSFSPAYWSDIEKGRRNPPNINKILEIANILKLPSPEIDELIDLAAEDRDEIPMDLPDYIKDCDLAKAALRKAKRKEEAGSSQVTKEA